MTISSLAEEPAAVDVDGSGERLRRRQEPSEEELPPTPFAVAEHHDFGIAVARLLEDKGLGHGEGGVEGTMLEEGECGSMCC